MNRPAHAWTAILAALATLAALDAPTSDQLKAAVVSKIVPFVTWPAPTLDGSDEPLSICLLGRPGLEEGLARAVEGRRAHGRALSLRPLDNLEQADRCHVLYVAARESAPLDHILRVLSDAPVLLIGEKKGFAAEGGMINLLKVDRGIRFEINYRAVKRAGFQMSSRLLGLAVRVYD